MVNENAERKTKEAKLLQARKLLRLKRPAIKNMEYECIIDNLWKMSEAVGDIQYSCDDSDEIMKSLEEDDGAAEEFKTLCADLDYKINALQQYMSDGCYAYDDYGDGGYKAEEDFNIFLVGLVGRYYNESRGIEGYDPYEQDFFMLDEYDAEKAEQKAIERMMRKTKRQMINCIQRTLDIYLRIFEIQDEYNFLMSAFDFIRDENFTVLQQVRKIDEAYERAEKATCGFKYDYGGESRAFESLLGGLPPKIWIG